MRPAVMLLLVLPVAGCGVPSDSREPECMPGEWYSCTCEQGGRGTQQCAGDWTLQPCVNCESHARPSEEPQDLFCMLYDNCVRGAYALAAGLKAKIERDVRRRGFGGCDAAPDMYMCRDLWLKVDVILEEELAECRVKYPCFQ